MIAVDGADVRRDLELDADVVVVGSGPAGAMVARTLARRGVRVVVVEEGPFVRPADMPEDSFSAMAGLYRDMGASLMLGAPPMPFVQGRVVGGTSVVNGAISWRLPEDVHAAWVADDPALGDALPFAELTRLFDAIEADLGIAPTEPTIAGPNNLLLAKGAEALGLEHRPIARNVRGCRGLGRCLQGCPEGNKTSMDRSYLPDAVSHGARIVCNVEVGRVRHARGRAVGVEGRAKGGGTVTVRARRAVVLAASAVQTPVLLIRSGLGGGVVGHGFSAHPGAAVAGRFAEPVRLWEGATQGHEVIGLRKERLKFEALGYDMTLVAARTKGAGRRLVRGLEDLAHFAHWGAAVKARARGTVRAGPRRAIVTYSLEPDDLRTTARGVKVLCEMMFAAGAELVYPGVFGWPDEVTDRAALEGLPAPSDPNAYTMAVTHMFGTCRLGSRPADSVVGLDFQHHAMAGLYVADSSVFPTNTGVNPQTSILALAAVCARHVEGR